MLICNENIIQAEEAEKSALWLSAAAALWLRRSMPLAAADSSMAVVTDGEILLKRR